MLSKIAGKHLQVSNRLLGSRGGKYANFNVRCDIVALANSWYIPVTLRILISDCMLLLFQNHAKTKRIESIALYTD